MYFVIDKNDIRDALKQDQITAWHITLILMLIIIVIIIIFVYLIADIPHNLTLLTSTTQGGTHKNRHAGQRYIQKG